MTHYPLLSSHCPLLTTSQSSSLFTVTPTLLVRCVPPGQGNGADAACGQTRNRGHASQAVVLVCDWKVPALHDVHSANPQLAANVPGLQLLGVAVPP